MRLFWQYICFYYKLVHGCRLDFTFKNPYLTPWNPYLISTCPCISGTYCRMAYYISAVEIHILPLPHISVHLPLSFEHEHYLGSLGRIWIYTVQIWNTACCNIYMCKHLPVTASCDTTTKIVPSFWLLMYSTRLAVALLLLHESNVWKLFEIITQTPALSTLIIKMLTPREAISASTKGRPLTVIVLATLVGSLWPQAWRSISHPETPVDKIL